MNQGQKTSDHYTDSMFEINCFGEIMPNQRIKPEGGGTWGSSKLLPLQIHGVQNEFVYTCIFNYIVR